jgi:hypothetical protein
VAGCVTRLRQALVDLDPAAADVANRRLGPLARLPRLLRDARLQPLEVVVPPAQLRLDGRREARPVVGEVCGDRMLGDDEPRSQLRELLLDFVGSVADGVADGRLLLPHDVEVTADARSLRAGGRALERPQPIDPAANLGKLLLDRGRAHVEPPVRLFL